MPAAVVCICVTWQLAFYLFWHGSGNWRKKGFFSSSEWQMYQILIYAVRICLLMIICNSDGIKFSNGVVSL